MQHGRNPQDRGIRIPQKPWGEPEIVDPDGFFSTGDQARMDAAGCPRIPGRIKDIIIRSSENVTPMKRSGARGRVD
jgi:acyl-CoA synthetase (AMP-forming)/AMP-acid ligase II